MNKLLLAGVGLVLVALATGAPQGEEGKALQGSQAGLLVREAREADPKKNKNKVQKKEKKNKAKKNKKDKKEKKDMSCSSSTFHTTSRQNGAACIRIISRLNSNWHFFVDGFVDGEEFSLVSILNWQFLSKSRHESSLNCPTTTQRLGRALQFKS